MLRLVLADDHSVVLEGLKALLDTEPALEVVALCRDGNEALEAVETHRPDVLVVDASMPGCSGVEAAAQIRKRGIPVPIVVLSATLDDATLVRCLELGVEGLILKESAGADLTEAILAVGAGKRWIAEHLAERGLDLLARRGESAVETLTPREREVVDKVVAGRSNRKVALELAIAEGTVKLHLHNAFRKLQVGSRLELTVLARDQGWA